MGKLNLLHHKSWHVYGKDNREKVRKDEEEARLKEEKEKARVLQAEKEFRLNKLKAKNGLKTQQQNQTSEHLNLFADFEQKIKEKNPEHEEEKRKKEEKWDRDNKITSYLAGAGGKVDENPWYAKPGPDDQKFKNSRVLKHDDRMKRSEDPISKLDAYQSSKKSSHKKQHQSIQSSSSSISSSSMEKMREQRLKREVEERRRASLLLYPEDKLSTTDKKHVEKGSRYYNSQFNPEFTRSESQKHKPYFQ